MKNNKCPYCGAPLNSNDNNSNALCPYCGEHNSENKNSNGSQSNDKRPEIDTVLAIVLCVLWVWPGIIYILITLYRQNEWDKKHNKK